MSKNEKKFAEFFNKSSAITIKRHQLELLPGMGKKHMLDILTERDKKPFEGIVDLEKRVHSLPHVPKMLAKRIMLELEGLDPKHYLFVRPPSKHDEHGERPR